MYRERAENQSGFSCAKKVTCVYAHVVGLSDLLFYPARKCGGDDGLPVGASDDALLLQAKLSMTCTILRGFLERRAPRTARRHHVDAIDRAGRQAQPAADAPWLDHGVHQPLRADDGVDRTGVDAARAADAARFVDQGHRVAFHKPV